MSGDIPEVLARAEAAERRPLPLAGVVGSREWRSGAANPSAWPVSPTRSR